MATTARSMRDRVLATYAQASPLELEDGARWYAEAQRISADLGFRYGVSTHTAAGVISAMSPRTQWQVNLDFADRLLASAWLGESGPPAVHTTKGRAKAWLIVQGAEPMGVLNKGGAGKTTSFYRAIMGEAIPVVDVWAARCAEGKDFRDRAPEGRRYREIEKAYLMAARVAGVGASEMQAVTWIVTRGSAW